MKSRYPVIILLALGLVACSSTSSRRGNIDEESSAVKTMLRAVYGFQGKEPKTVFGFSDNFLAVRGAVVVEEVHWEMLSKRVLVPLSGIDSDIISIRFWKDEKPYSMEYSKLNGTLHVGGNDDQAFDFEVVGEFKDVNGVTVFETFITVVENGVFYVFLVPKEEVYGQEGSVQFDGRGIFH